MTLDQKIGQMIMVGFRGSTIDETGSLTKFISKGLLGGIILFEKDHLSGAGRNIKSARQLAKLCCDLQSLSPFPLFVAIDQEGGKVNRLKEKHGFPPTVSHASLALKNDLPFTFEKASVIARTLFDVGINLNFAPVVDLNTNPENPVIGRLERSFSSEVNSVVDHATEFIKAHHKHGVLCAIKHFPGHGSSKTDSHLGFTDISETWCDKELEPFSKLINSGLADAVMIGHVFNSKLDKKFPASLSSEVISGLLRGELTFNGLVITDDLQMRALSSEYNFLQIIEKSVLSGADIVLAGNNLDYDDQLVFRIHEIIKNLLSEGKIAESRIDESLSRIWKCKSNFSTNEE